MFSYESVERHTKKLSIFKMEKIFFPVNVVHHWILLCADMIECRILVYDSFSMEGLTRYTEAVLRYLKEEAISKTGCSLTELTGGRDWRIEDESCSQQDNSFDCGVFTCIFLECLALSLPFYITPSNVERCREKIGGDLLRGRLST